MTERVPWWRAFLPKRRTGSTKDIGPDFDPFAPRPERPKDHATGGSNVSGNQAPNQTEGSSTTVYTDDTYDDSQLESVFDERSCRRNMKVSRSGRFKEKRRGRSSLPIEDKETETVALDREDKR